MKLKLIISLLSLLENKFCPEKICFTKSLTAFFSICVPSFTKIGTANYLKYGYKEGFPIFSYLAQKGLHFYEPLIKSK